MTVDVKEPVCAHKELFPLLPSEIFPTIFLPLLLGIASVAGVGGGMVVVPVAIGLFHFTSKEAIAISTAIVFETAIIRFVFFSAWTKHPQKPERTEIDYNTVRVVYPLFLVGAYLGVIFYIILSELWITILIIAILGFLSIHMIIKARKKFMDESKQIALEAEKKENELNNDFRQESSLKVDDTPNFSLNKSPETEPLLSNQLSESEEQLLEEIEQRERTCCSQWRV